MEEQFISELLREAQAAEAIAVQDMMGEYSRTLGKGDGFDLELAFRDALYYGEDYALGA